MRQDSETNIRPIVLNTALKYKIQKYAKNTNIRSGYVYGEP